MIVNPITNCTRTGKPATIQVPTRISLMARHVNLLKDSNGKRIGDGSPSWG